MVSVYECCSYLISLTQRLGPFRCVAYYVKFKYGPLNLQCTPQVTIAVTVRPRSPNIILFLMPLCRPLLPSWSIVFSPTGYTHVSSLYVHAI